MTKYVRGILGIIKNIDNSNVTTYYVYNAHGDVTALTNSSGTVTKNYDYDPFGNEINPNPNDTNPFRYCGEYFDKETGDYYLRARYYSPGRGRFNAQDPAMDGMNWYVYCGNNPIFYVDPSGLVSVIFCAQGMEEHADAQKKFYTDKYKTDSYRIVVGSAKELRDKWNEWFGEGGLCEGLTIDAIEIISHGGITGDVGKDENGIAYSTGFLYFGDDHNNNRLFARADSNMNSSDLFLGGVRPVTAKELNVNACNSANKDTYNVMFGFMQMGKFTKVTGWDGGTDWKWDDDTHTSGRAIRGGGDYTTDLPIYAWGDPWYYVKKHQSTWWRYVEKSTNGAPVRDRIGKITFY